MDYLAAIRDDAGAIFELCARNLGRPIPSCPGWSAADLREHIIDTFRGAIEGFGDDVPPPDAVERALELLHQDAAPARDVSHECAVHRWDASVAFDVDHEIDPQLACDAIVGFFEDAWPMLLAYLKRPAGSGETLRLQRTDSAEHWLILLSERATVTHDDVPGDVTVEGSASDLALWLWGRMDPPHVSGDRSVLEGIRNPRGRLLSPGF